MNSSNGFKPNWASAPGDTIRDILSDRNLTLSSFANTINSSTEFVNNLVEGYISITDDIALQLELYLGGSKDFWIKRELDYRQALIRVQKTEQEAWIKELPIKDMLKYGWIKGGIDSIAECLRFFGVNDISSWRSKYDREIQVTAFRKSTAFKSAQGSIATWLRQGEIQSEQIICSPWDEKLFEVTLEEIRSLTRMKSPKDFIPELTRLCAQCGVAISIVPTPTGCPASGATKFITPTRALIMLSFRYLSDDHFWFTFFHEAGHLILHSPTSVFIEEIRSGSDGQIEEEEANAFAGEMLIPYNFQSELKNIKGNKRNIINFAIKAGVSPGIVVGQLQHHGIIERQYLNSYKRRYSWDDILNLSKN